jgi:pectinesterase
MKIYGYSANQVTIQAGVSATQVGSGDASGTLAIHKDNFQTYKVNVKNTFGKGSQAIALSRYGSRVGLYACGFFVFCSGCHRLHFRARRSDLLWR